MAKGDEQIWDGVWFSTPRSWRLVCCHCQLVHDVDHKVTRAKNGHIKIHTKMSQHLRATAARRRIFSFGKDEDEA